MTVRDFIKKKLDEGFSLAEIRGFYQDYIAGEQNPATFSSYIRTIQKVTVDEKMFKMQDELIGLYTESNAPLFEKALNLSRQKQALQDTNRILTAENRKEFRGINVVEKLTQELLTELPKIKVPGKIPKLKKSDNAVFGVIQFTDHHFNELIHEDEIGNSFDFVVGSKRLKKLADESDRIFKAYGITEIVITFLGDMINSDRRLDETLHKASNRARAVLLACHLYRQMFEDLISRGYSLKIATVTGNESRIGEFHDSSDIQATDNFDFLIHNILKTMFSAEKNIAFFNADWKESVLNIDGTNLLMLHGEAIKQEKNVRDLYAKWAQKGVMIDFVLHGHFHATMITDISARGSSLCGANAYSDKTLCLYSKAAQNVHVFMKNKTIHSMKIDLQNVENEGYDVIKELESYNVKSARKVSDSKYLVIPLNK